MDRDDANAVLAVGIDGLLQLAPEQAGVAHDHRSPALAGAKPTQQPSPTPAVSSCPSMLVPNCGRGNAILNVPSSCSAPGRPTASDNAFQSGAGGVAAAGAAAAGCLPI